MQSTLTRRQILAAALVLAPIVAFGLPRIGWAQETPAPAPAPVPSPAPVADMALGDPNAPLTVIEYAMYSCPHCADFNRDTFPQVKKDYIDTGKIRWIFREVYFNKPGLWAAMIARCAPADRYFGIADLVFSTQNAWMVNPDGSVRDDASMMQALYRIGRQAGLSDAEMDKCMNDRAFAESLVAAYQKNAAADGINSTPTFIMGGKKVGSGYMPYDQFKAELDKALGA
ncbi:MAG: DsbA family protein [Amaricoccus sp.]|uniref:DsbA family protein n=1 Tax=Amaricoccus sp. TaxID=1872485 RepID=UPI0039E5F7FC